METLLSAASSIFWGVIVLSLLVFVHEGGHFLAARACGVRVTEFFLGLPCRLNFHRTSKRIGTRFGVTPLLLGGYAAISGMDPEEPALAPAVLTAVHTRGTASVAELAGELGADEDEVLEACAFLLGWGSLAPVYNEEAGEGPHSRYYPTTYAAMPRDAAGNTVYDGRAFDRAGATSEGEAWEPPMDANAFYASERRHTYMGRGFWARALMLVAGIGVNIVTGFAIMVFALSVLGQSAPQDVNTIGGVTAGSPAAEAGLTAGDAITRVDGAETATWMDILNALSDRQAGDEVSLSWEHDGSAHDATVTLDAEGCLGIEVSTATVRLSPIDAITVTGSLISRTAEGVMRLIQPQHTMEVLESSSSVVGISVMSAQAAASGPASLLTFMALISFSLGFMNLLPIPPLDGGKLLIEIIQAVTRRQVPLRAQTYLSYAGIALFGLLFVFMLRTDILRLLG
ncbi:M50 family metallopeptidase [Collinsella vaginalis]|uniref:M50 family metallopeptidase n=1 Tax=Collinsella vaginalis TaxID=1870987 RepID=UPI000A268C1A|nr:M50 family metallopeptidase [Collinsella vaginalis]